MTESRPYLSTLAFVGFEINAALEKGRGEDVTFEDIYENLQNGNILGFLTNRIPGEFDFSLFPPGSEQSTALNYVLNEVAGGLEGRERRKVGIEKSGLHLLMAFILEALQARYWIDPKGR